jgi:hypothetical protein
MQPADRDPKTDEREQSPLNDLRSDTPNVTDYRRQRFHVGFNHGAVGRSYNAQALARITWQNLGNRLGSIIGPADAVVIDRLYNLCVNMQAAEIGDE